MRVFLFEHCVGGGELHATLPPRLAGQGGAMLTALSADLRRAGHTVTSMLDMRAGVALDQAATYTLTPADDPHVTFDRLAQQAEATLVIAPETGGCLLDWTRRLESLGAPHLGSTPDTIELCADKLAMDAHLRSHDIPTPTTVSEARTLECPLVAKPRDGAGCEHTHVVRDARALAELEDETSYVFQPWHSGRAASVSLIAYENGAQPLQPGAQRITGETTLRYDGGRVPLDAALAQRAVDLAARAVRTVAGLRGFVGVDLVLAENGEGSDVVIEINPRPTVSLVALANLCEPALAAALFDPSVTLQWSPHGLRFDEFGRIALEPSEW